MKKALKRSVSVILAVAIIIGSAYAGLCELDFNSFFAIEAKAADESVLTFTLNDDGVSYSVTDCDTAAEGELTIPAEYEGLPVTGIGNSAFFMCITLTSVVIPDSIVSIGDAAFWSSWSISSVDISNSVVSIGSDAFSNTGIKAITIPDSVVSIGDEAFRGCSQLTSVEIGSGTTSIGDKVFRECSNLTAINVAESNTAYVSVDGVLFNKDKTNLIKYPSNKTDTEYVIPNSVNTIETYAFQGSENITCVTISDSVVSIDDYAFLYCTNLTSIVIPDTVTSLGERAFGECVKLVTIDVNENNDYYSSDDGVLFNKDKTVLIQYPSSKTTSNYICPDSVTTIADFAFQGSANLASVVISENVTSIGSYAFHECTSLTSVEAIGNLTSIGSYAFFGCTSLESVTVPDCLKSVCERAFDGCANLTVFTIPGNVTSVGSGAFANCTNLVSIVLPVSVTYIESYVFEHCVNLSYVFYGGSEADWSAVTIDDVGNDLLTYAVVHYSTTGHMLNEGTVATQPTCTVEGFLTKSCTTEGCTYTESSAIDVLGHDFSTEWTVDVEPTCTEEGSKSYHCSRCDVVSEVTAIECIPHDYSTEWTIDVEPTCTEEGSKSRHCTACDDKTDITAIECIPHDYSTEWTIDKEASCSEEGSKSHHCTACGDKADVTAIEKLPHTPSQNLVHAPGFNCESGEMNYMHRLCTVCKAVLEVFEVEPGHSYVDGVCEKCGLCNFSYTVSNGKVTITGYTGPIGQVTIPTTIGGYPVEKVGANAFSGNSRITDVIIPDGMIIGDGAFDSAPNLKTVTIGNNVTLGTDVFVDSTLEKVIFTDDVVDVQENCFNGNTSIKEVVFGSNVKTVGASAFNGCTALESIYIPESVDTIGASAFCGCTGLEEAVIDGATTIGVGAFQDCSKLLDVAIGDKTETIDESAFAKSGVNHLVLGNNVKTIGARAFENAKNLQVVYLPDGIQTINEEAFYYSGLQTIILPDSVETVGNEAFATINLKYAQLGTGLKNVGEVAFYGTLMNVVVPKEAEGFVQGSIVVNDFTEIYYDGTEEQFLQLKENSVFMSSSESFDASTVTYVNSLPLSSGYADDYCYFEYPAGNINVVDYLGYDLSVVLPSSINGKPVTDIYTTFIPVLDLIDLIDDGVEEQQVAEWFCPSEITLSENITEIGDFAFMYCLGLETLNLPETLTSIGNAAFGYCLKLTNINLPHSLKRIGFDAFVDSAIYDAQENWENNVLYWDNCLIDVSSSFTGDLVVKDGTRLIADGVATGNTGIQDLHLPESLEIIGESAFSGIFRVEANIGGEETVVSDPTQYIFYKGTQEQWDDIVIHNDNDIFAMYPVHFEATDHTIASEWETDVTPGCTHGGTQIKKCLYCTYKITGELTATGHTLDENGVCKYCTSEVAESAHYFEESIDETVTLQKETAGSVTLSFSEDTQAGYIYIYDANDTLIGEYAGSDLAGETIIIQGNTVKIRLVSSGNMNEYGYYADVLWACAHTPAEPVNVKEATCEEDGYTGDVYCQNCAYVYSMGETVAATGHDVENSVCLNCGESEFDYEIIDGQVTITGYRSFDDIVGAVQIPSAIGGYPVVAIDGAFEECDTVTKISIPSSVTSISDGSFFGAWYLTDITVSEESEYFTSVDGVLFNKDKAKLICYPMDKAGESYKIPEGVEEIGAYAFAYSTNLRQIDFPSSVTTINSGAFLASLIESVVLPDSVKTIGESAFESTTNLKYVEIGSGVESVGTKAFAGCFSTIVLPSSLANFAEESIYAYGDLTIYFDGTEEQMAQLIADNAICYGGELTVICGKPVAYGEYEDFRYIETPSGEIHIYNYVGNAQEVTVPSYINEKPVTCIGSTFMNYVVDFNTGDLVQNNIKKITIPDTVKQINYLAFFGNTNLITVELPDTLTKIGGYVFEETLFYMSAVNWYDGGLYAGNYLVGSGSNITEIEVKEGTTLIADRALTSNLQEILIPTSLEYIGANNFGSSAKITAIFYPGTQEQWSQISVAGNNEGIDNAYIHYNATGHTEGEWIIDTLPTNSAKGSRHKVCSVCELTTQTQALPVLTGFGYSSADDTTCTLDSFYDTQAEVVIPEEYNGKAVTAIGSGCFKDDMFVESIVIPETVTEIGSLAFMNCEKLETVRIPESVTEIGARAFYGFSGKIICWYGSYAHTYAVENGIECTAITVEARDSNTNIDYDNKLIFTTYEGTQSLAELIKTASVLSSHTSVEVNFYGTGNVIELTENGNVIEEYTLIVDGDLNGDSVCDALDAAIAANVSSGLKTVSTEQIYAANGAIADEIDVFDYQRLVNKAVA